jgi:hypothetical protein
VLADGNIARKEGRREGAKLRGEREDDMRTRKSRTFCEERGIRLDASLLVGLVRDSVDSGGGALVH